MSDITVTAWVNGAVLTRAELTCSGALRSGKPGGERVRPVGAATAAREEGQQFFEIQLVVGRHTGSAGFGSTEGRHTTSSSAATIGEIEKLGWRLEHAGYYFMITGETSTDRMFISGEATAINGVTMGVYLFRNTSLADSVP